MHVSRLFVFGAARWLGRLYLVTDPFDLLQNVEYNMH
jgi:hypothetical protein